MTEQEAEAFAERLRRIWAGKQEAPLTRMDSKCGRGPRLLRGESLWYLGKVNGFRFETQPVRAINVTVYKHPFYQDIKFSLAQRGGYFGCGQLDTINAKIVFLRNPDGDEQFAAQWLPFFRRGCWLSGCPIEATAHEKAEWMQGFTKEELKWWSFKF